MVGWMGEARRDTRAARGCEPTASRAAARSAPDLTRDSSTNVTPKGSSIAHAPEAQRLGAEPPLGLPLPRGPGARGGEAEPAIEAGAACRADKAHAARPCTAAHGATDLLLRPHAPRPEKPGALPPAPPPPRRHRSPSRRPGRRCSCRCCSCRCRRRARASSAAPRPPRPWPQPRPGRASQRR